MGAILTLRVVAAASRPLPHARCLHCAGEIGPISLLRVLAPASTALPQARRLLYAGELGSIYPLRIVARASSSVARARGLPTTTFLLPVLFPARCLPPRQDDVPAPPQSLNTPEMPVWWNVVSDISSATTKRPFLHPLAVFVMWGIRSSGFKNFVEWAVLRLKLPQKVTGAILLGATVITVLFDAAIMGKDINDVSSYLLTHGPKVDPQKSVSSTSD